MSSNNVPSGSKRDNVIMMTVNHIHRGRRHRNNVDLMTANNREDSVQGRDKSFLLIGETLIAMIWHQINSGWTFQNFVTSFARRLNFD